MSDQEGAPRRSGRRRTLTQRFVESVHIEPEDDGLSPSPSNSRAHEPDSDSGDEYDIGEEEANARSADGADGYVSSESGSDEEEGPSVSGSDESDRSDSEELRPRSSSVHHRRLISGGLYSRRLLPLQKSFSKDYALFYIYPDNETDRLPLLNGIRKWSADLSFPSRRADERGIGGPQHSFFLEGRSQFAEELSPWDWYCDNGGRQQFELASACDIIEANQATPYLLSDQPPAVAVLGTLDHQDLHQLQLRQPFLLGNATDDISSRHPPSAKRHRNWLINIGEPVQCTDWAPRTCQHSQFLAVSTWSKEFAELTSAFSPSEDLPCSIQIWEFPTRQVGDSKCLALDYDKPPSLRLVLCFDWGLVKAMKWCPTEARPQDDNNNSVGLLAVIFTDGAIRVFDVRIPDPTKTSTQFVQYTSAAFESKPPNTVCTCLAWIYPSVLAAGCAEGSVAMWNLSDSLSNNNSGSNAAPFFHRSFHSTIITAISSCLPSRPNFIVTTSMDGYARLTDLRDPEIDHVYSHRSRLGTIPLIWHEQTQHVICADDSQYLRCHNIRCFFKSIRNCDLEAAVLSLASSPVHASVLIGAVDGSVICTNPLSGLMESRRVSKGRFYRQKWFTHEWRRGVAVDNANPSDDAPLDFPHGLSRIMIGHPLAQEPEEPVRRDPEPRPRHSRRNWRGKRSRPIPSTHNNQHESRYGPSGVVFTTLYEEETGARCVAWHPDVQCGGWAAAGLASGLLVVSDLAVDQ